MRAHDSFKIILHYLQQSLGFKQEISQGSPHQWKKPYQELSIVLSEPEQKERC